MPTTSMQAEWAEWMRAPPAEAKRQREALMARSERLAASWIDQEASAEVAAAHAFPSKLDIVVPGSGFHVLLYLGVQSVLARLEDRGRVQVGRFAGASSGGQAPAQWLILGEAGTLDLHLSFGMLWDAHCPNAGIFKAGPHLKRTWRMMVQWCAIAPSHEPLCPHHFARLV